MKPLNEEQSMLIFDLLEGNLSETEKAAAIERINSDANLKKEYELLKKTYLQKDDAVHFPDKTALHQIPKSTNRLYLFLKPIAAAAVLLIISGIGIYYFRSQTDTVNTGKISEKTSPINPPAAKEEKNIPEIPSNAPTTLIVLESKHISSPISAADTALNPSAEKPGSNILSLAATAPRAATFTEESTEEIEYRIAFYPQPAAPATNRKKRSLYYQLFKTGRTMLANLQLPEVKIKTQKSTHRFPNINIQINTPANYATYNEN
jgi:hypothetical protein